MPPTSVLYHKAIQPECLKERQMQYFLLVGGEEAEEGRDTALLCKAAIIKAAFPLLQVAL